MVGIAASIGQQNPVGNALAQATRFMEVERESNRRNELLAVQMQAEGRKALRDEEKLAFDRQNSERDHLLKTAPIIARAVAGANDQAGWDMALRTAEQFRIPLQGVPRQFDPGYKAELSRTLSAFIDPKENAPLSGIGKLEADLKAGRITPQQYEEGKGTLGGPRVDVKVGQHADKGLIDLDVDRMKTHGEGRAKLRGIMPDLDRFEAALNSGAQTGAGQEWFLRFKQAAGTLGWDIPGTTEQEVIKSIQSRLAPAMRIPGSGASSDRDVAMFLEGLPNIARGPNGNRQVIAQLRRIEKRQGQEATYMREYFRKNKNSLEGVDEAMDRDLGPLFPRLKSKEEMDRLPSGEVFIAPDGSMRVKP